ncbi:MAG: hypothetical protein AAFV53_24330 [Myxococcota bacterium]
MPFLPLILFAIALVGGLAVLVVVGVIQLPGLLNPSARPALPDVGASSQSPPTVTKTQTPAAPDYTEGEDLLRYPRRLSELEQQLSQSFRSARNQMGLLKDRMTGLQGKSGREDIALRYQRDFELLEQRGKSMQRVLGLVWRTRAILEMRAHLAITARRRPQLEALPDTDIAHERLPEAVDAYEGAAHEVRRFVGDIRNRADELPLAIPGEPVDAEINDALREEIAAERVRVRKTYDQLHERMDHLADTLLYLADRCRTRQVVEGSPTAIDARDAHGEALIDQVNGALLALNDLAEVGEIHLADSTLDALAEDISQLERAGLEVQAEADAAMEVARLLEQFQTPS